MNAAITLAPVQVGPPVCQVADPGIWLPCTKKESGGMRCERLDPHGPDDDHRLSEHTIDHALLGNGYACAAIDPAYPAPRVEVASYRVHPSGYDESDWHERDDFVVEVACVDPVGDAWTVARFPHHLSRDGVWVYLPRLHHADEIAAEHGGRDGFVMPREKALRMAVTHVDRRRVVGRTFPEWLAHFAAEQATGA